VAGEMVARANNVTLEEYMEKYIWRPLGMTDMTFHPSKNISVKQKLVDMSCRDAGVTMFGVTDNPDAKFKYMEDSIWSHDTNHCYGGSGCYGSYIQFQSLLHSITADDGKVLKASTVDKLFAKQLPPAAQAALAAQRQIPAINNIFGGDPPNLKFDRAFGGILNETSFPGRAAGTVSGGGLPNLLWFMDRKSGISGSKSRDTQTFLLASKELCLTTTQVLRLRFIRRVIQKSLKSTKRGNWHCTSKLGLRPEYSIVSLGDITLLPTVALK